MLGSTRVGSLRTPKTTSGALILELAPNMHVMMLVRSFLSDAMLGVLQRLLKVNLGMAAEATNMFLRKRSVGTLSTFLT